MVPAVDAPDPIANLVDLAAAAWPAFVVDRTACAAHFRAAGAGPGTHVADLYLAFACMGGDEAAWRVLDQHLAAVPASVARVDASAGFGDDVRQRLAEKLLGGKLAEYAGRGPLGAFFRIIAVRDAQKVMRGRRSRESSGIGEVAASTNDPELALLRHQAADAFHQAYARTMAALDDETRTTLRLYFVDGLTFEQLGRALACSRATAARRLADARTRVLAGVKDVLRNDLGASAPGAESLFALIESQLQISVLRHLGKTG